MNNENKNNSVESENHDFFEPTPLELEMALDYVDYLLDLTDENNNDSSVEYYFYD